MQLRNTPHRYGIISIGLHWIFALAVYAMFGLGLWMVTLSYYDGWYHQAPELHKSIGVLLMMGLVVRVVWRHISPPPPAPKTHGKFTRVSAVAAHIALYALLFAILISGYLISTADGKPISVFGLFDVPPRSAMLASRRIPLALSICGWPGAWLFFLSFTGSRPSNITLSIKTTR